MAISHNHKFNCGATDCTSPMRPAVKVLKDNFDIEGDGVAKLNVNKAKKSGYFKKLLGCLFNNSVIEDKE